MPVLVPALCLKLVLTLVMTLYAFFALMKPELRIPCALLLVVWLVVANSSAFKYRFPNLSYATLTDVRAPASAAEAGLWSDRGALSAWRAGLPETARPKLVIAGVSGGAYRASFWVGSVLDALAAKVPTFHRHVRLICGASGGMVGAAYFAKFVNDVQKSGRERSPAVVDRFAAETGYDSFLPVVQHLFQHDLPKVFAPIRHQPIDRGIVLERCWPTLGGSFPELFDHEERGGCPSVVFSPMLVETGQRLLVSNLDLGHLAGVADGGRLRPSALEFFKLFPHARRTFLVQTAVRMQATFPYLSPAVCLPTDPPLRVVDGGFYDNYGVNLAMAWAAHHRDWLVEHTSGVAFVQIRAFNHASPLLASGPVARSLHWLTSPVDGVGGARVYTMKYRNDEQVALTKKSFDERKPGFPFETFVFENEAEFAMNWFLHPDDVTAMREDLRTGESSDEVGRFAEWWEREGAAYR